MALKDLTVSGAQLTEQQIESLIGPFARFDPGAGTIVLLPSAARLSVRQRVLLFLAAIQGWPFVTDKAHPTTVRPAALSEALRVPGGTLRPLLIKLRQEHLVVANSKGDYSVASAALGSIREELQRQEATEVEQSQKRKSTLYIKPAEKGAVPTVRRKGKRHGGESGAFVSWVKDGYFDRPRTFGEVLERFHSQGRMLKSTSLPGYLLEATRANVLNREKKDVDGKRVWVYSAPKRPVD